MTKIVVCVYGCLLSASLCAAQARVAGVPVPAQVDQTRGPATHEWTLREVLIAVLAQHPLVEAARARADASRGDRLTAGLFPNPVGTYWSENSRFPGQSALTGVDLETAAYATLPLEPLLQRAPRVRAADESIKEAESSIAAAQREVALQVLRAFFKVALAQVSVDATKENSAALEPLAAFSRARVAEGVMPEVELLRVQVELDRAGANLGLAEADLARAGAELRALLGESGAQLGSTGALRVAVPPGPVGGSVLAPLNDLLARAAATRPELLSARARLASATATIDYERSLSVRQLGATFGLKRTAGRSSLIGGLSMSIPLFDRNQGGVARASAEERAARQEIAWMERTVAGEVQGAYAAAQQLSQQVGALRPGFVQRAGEVHRITLAAYQEGGASLLQVLDASRMVADAQLTYARTLFAERESIFELALAAGTEPTAAVVTLESASVPAPGGARFDGGRK